MPELAWLDGRWMPLEEARISPLDRGFLFGDGIYEALRTAGWRVRALDMHLARLRRSLAAVRMSGIDMDVVRTLLVQASDRADLPDALIYLQITRGAAPRNHLFPETDEPTVFLSVRPDSPLPPETYATGVAVVTTPEIRWARRDIKSVNLLPNVLAKQAAREQGAFEALFVEADGRVNEGASNNLFLVHGERLATPPASRRILCGVTRGLIISTARAAGLAVEEREIGREELRTASELFLSGTTSEALAITQLDGEPVGGGRPGPLTQRVRALLRQRLRLQEV